MTPIVYASWDDLGYKKFPCYSPKQLNNLFKDDAKNKYNYEVIKDISGLWIRKKERTKNFTFIPPVEIAGTITSSNYKSFDYSFIDKYIKSQYVKRPKGFKYVTLDQIETAVKFLEKNKTDCKAYKRIYNALFSSEPSRLKEILIDIILPTYFKIHPSGEVLAIKYNFDYELLYSIQRTLYFLDNYPNDIKNVPLKHVATLRDWQPLDLIGFIQKIVSLVNISFYPNVIGFEAGLYGLSFEFIFSDKIIQELPIFPVDWVEYFSSNSQFGFEKFKLDDYFSKLEQNQNKSTHKRYLNTWSPNIEEVKIFFKWVIDKTNRLLFELLDPCNCVIKNEISSTWSFENHLSIERLLRRTIDTITNRNAFSRKASTFEVADLYGAIAKSFNSALNESKYFKNLFHPQNAKDLFNDIFSDIPAPFNNQFIKISNELYSELKDTVSKSIFINSKKTSNNEIIRKNKENSGNEKISIDDFTSDLIRSLRNAHHGYITKNDQNLRPSRNLSLTNGNLNDSLTYLPVLWWYALLQNPKKMIGWDYLDINKY